MFRCRLKPDWKLQFPLAQPQPPHHFRPKLIKSRAKQSPRSVSQSIRQQETSLATADRVRKKFKQMLGVESFDALNAQSLGKVRDEVHGSPTN